MLNALRFSVKTSECSLLFFYWREKKIETFLDISGIAAGKKNGFFIYLSIFLAWLLLWWEMSPSINAVTMQEGEATMQEMQGQSPWQHNGLTSYWFRRKIYLRFKMMNYKNRQKMMKNFWKMLEQESMNFLLEKKSTHYVPMLQ